MLLTETAVCFIITIFYGKNYYNHDIVLNIKRKLNILVCKTVRLKTGEKKF